MCAGDIKLAGSLIPVWPEKEVSSMRGIPGPVEYVEQSVDYALSSVSFQSKIMLFA